MIDPQLHDEAPVVTRRTLRQFAALTIAILGGLVLWHRVSGEPRAFDAVVIVVTVVVGGGGLAFPEAIRPLYNGLIKLTAPIGSVVSYVILGVLFYGVFTPLGLLLRLSGRDPLAVKRPRRASHWSPKATAVDIREYTRQS